MVGPVVKRADQGLDLTLFRALHRLRHPVMPIQDHVLGIPYGVTVGLGKGDSSGWV